MLAANIARMTCMSLGHPGRQMTFLEVIADEIQDDRSVPEKIPEDGRRWSPDALGRVGRRQRKRRRIPQDGLPVKPIGQVFPRRSYEILQLL